MNSELKQALRTIVQSLRAEGYLNKKVSDLTDMGELKEFIDDINTEGKHYYFDFSDYIDNAYVCLVFSYTSNDVNYIWIHDLINQKTYGSYLGYEDETLIEDYIEGVNVQTNVRTITLTDTTMTESDMFDLLEGINTKGDSVFFNVASMQLPMYLCTFTIDEDKTKIRINDLVTGRKYIAKYEAAKTIYACLQAAKEDSAVIRVNATSVLNNSTIQVVGAVVTIKDANDIVIATGTYTGTTLEFPLPIYQSYKVSISYSVSVNSVVCFNPSTSDAKEGTLTGDTTINFSYANPGAMTTIQDATDFLQIVDRATAEEVLIGSEGNLHNFEATMRITDPENNTIYDMPVVAEKLYDAIDEDGVSHLAIYWSFKHCLPQNKVFDEREQVRANGETFEEDVFYYTGTSATPPADQTLTPLVAGTDYQVGDSVDAYETAHSGVYVYKHEFSNTKYGTGSKTTANLMRYGFNYFEESNLFKWLNGTGYDWFSPSHTGDRLASGYNSKKGFLDWIKSDDLAVIKKVKYGVNNIDLAGQVASKFTLLSGTEVAGSVNSDEGTVLLRWKAMNGGAIKNDANADRTITQIQNKTSKQTFWLRSPSRYNSFNEWIVSSNGNVNSGGTAYYSYAVVPAFTTY